jgi:hypothetical protein
VHREENNYKWHCCEIEKNKEEDCCVLVTGETALLLEVAYMSRIVIVILIYRHHKPIDSVNLLGSYRRRSNVFPVI